MIADPARVIEVFTEAMLLPAEARCAFLERACAGNDALRCKLEALLKSSDRAEGFLEHPPETIGEARDKAAAWEKPGDTVDRYRLLEQIGEGGCGVVFVAEQQSPVLRRVALKVVKPGMDTRSVIARFEAERQALALMDHPGIAHVFDAGATERGRPYFVMELVEGLRITDYCDRHALSIGARLELFIQVCDAVQHAHQKGIIHRDIKPSNIIVTAGLDGKPLPKIIDFGIAKATAGQRLTDKTILTECEMLIGTPAYMSPEQAALASADADTRTDIYSLGVLLYELLTGTTPFDTHELLKKGLDEVRRVIQEEEPVRPSARLGAMLAGDLKNASELRKAGPPKLVREVQGDPDWIVMKALEKDRRRRYQTASAMVEDVQRYLHHETISARPPSVTYRFQKLVVRHKLAFGAVGIILTTLAAGLTVTLWSLKEERHARTDAETARKDADKQRRKAEESQQHYLQEYTRSVQATLFMNDMLEGVGPAVANGRDTTLLKEIFDKAAERLERQAAMHPVVQADLRYTIARGYQSLRVLEKVEPLLRANLAFYRGRPDLKAGVSETLYALAGLHQIVVPPRLQEAEQEVREALEIDAALKGGESMQVLKRKTLLGWVVLKQGKMQEAEQCLREALATGERLKLERSVELIDVRNGLAHVLIEFEKFAEAEPLLQESLSVAQEKYGPSHVNVANCLYLLGMCNEAWAKLKEAEDLYRQCLEMRRRIFPADRPHLEGSLAALASVLQKEKKWKEAAEVYVELVALLRRFYGDQDGRVVRRTAALADVFIADGNEARFLQLAAEFPEVWVMKALDAARHGQWETGIVAATKLQELLPADFRGYHLLAAFLVQTGNRAACRELCAKICKQFAGTNDPVTAERMARACLLLPRPGADLKVPCELAETAVTHGTADTKSVHYNQFCKALAEYRQGRWESAALWARRAAGNPVPGTQAVSCAVLAMALHQLGQTDDARASLKECLGIMEKSLPKLEDEDLGGDWHDLITVHALLAEAQPMIEGKAPAASQQTKEIR
ncbi:MAG TPA: serine/threonine-protein kinase [Verrucomicrobiales bacterium]|nr:serine/threonine-protein kinase [Verrucomicrobiales bacterium]